jgi:hypothetical protein
MVLFCIFSIQIAKVSQTAVCHPQHYLTDKGRYQYLTEVAMPFSFHVLQEVALPWRQRQPKRALILAEAAEFAPRVQTLLKDDGWATYVPMCASTWLQLVHRPPCT